jgi:RNA polymerase sigma factor (sigma-70 family)
VRGILGPVASDAELLGAWQDGDRAAGGELIERHFRSLRRFFENKVTDGVDDLIQQTLLACVQHREQIRDAEAFRGYLFAAARTKLYDHLSKRAKQNDRIDFAVSSIAELGLSPSELVAAGDDRRLLLQALRRLPIDLQIALELYYFEQVRGHDLEIALDVPPGTVRSRLRRGLELLRRHVTEISASPEALRETSASLDRWAAELRAADPA